jgi:hypothetical protein
MLITRIAAALSLATPALAQTAGFDARPEGTSGITLTEGGLTFFDLDMRIAGQSPPYAVFVDNGSATLTGVAGFTSPNVLTFGSFMPGGECNFGRLGSVRISLGSPASQATVHVFEYSAGLGNLIVLAASAGGQQVASTFVQAGTCCSVHHYMLRVRGPWFDELRLYGWGGADEGVFYGAIDSISTGVGPSTTCYANCDGSTTAPFLNVLDFNCFLNYFAAGDMYANCDDSPSLPPILNILDFNCFLNRFSAGCSSP